MTSRRASALVTGGTSGIGRGVVERLAAAGYDVVFSGRNESAGRAVSEELHGTAGSVRFIPAELRDPASVENLVRQSADPGGSLQLLCHCAGVYPEHRIEDMELSDWHHVIDTNLTSAFLLTKHAAAHLAAHGRGRIVFISSITGPRTGIGGLAHYCASKGGLDGLMRGLAVELASRSVTVNAVAPGTVLTDALADLYAQPGVMESVTSIIPAGRLGRPADIAAVVEFLAGPDSGFITGQSIVVDGGQTIPEVQGTS